MIIEQLKQDLQIYRRNKDEFAVKFISTIIGEMSQLATVSLNDVAEKIVSDESAIKILKKFKTTAEEVLNITKDESKIGNLKKELEIVSKYLPSMLTGESLVKEIRNIISEVGPNIKDVMQALKVRFPSLYDGKEAKRIFDLLVADR